MVALDSYNTVPFRAVIIKSSLKTIKV